MDDPRSNENSQSQHQAMQTPSANHDSSLNSNNAVIATARHEPAAGPTVRDAEDEGFVLGYN